MFSKEGQFDSEGGSINALLGKGSEFEGKLIFEGTVRIDGVFKGEIESSDNLVVGESAVVKAEIRVNNIMVSGEIEGNIEANTRVEIRAPGKVIGNIKTPTLIIEEGVIFEGSCRMMEGRASSHSLTQNPSEGFPEHRLDSIGAKQ
jgi:cytoskeletal protein CcmA (bactofilin family)